MKLASERRSAIVKRLLIILAPFALFAAACANPAPQAEQGFAAVVTPLPQTSVVPTPSPAPSATPMPSAVPTSSPAPSATPTPQTSAVPTLSPAPSATPTPQTSAVPTPSPAPSTTPTPQTNEDVVISYEVSIVESGFATLDERIFRSDVIAIATMRSVSAAARPSIDGHYIAYLEFTFDVHEYLKGGGGESLDVDLRLGYWHNPLSRQDSLPGGVYRTEDDALKAGDDWIAEDKWWDHRDRWWDDRVSVVFLQTRFAVYDEAEPSAALADALPRYTFLSSMAENKRSFARALDPHYVDGFSIESEQIRSWLPSSSTAVSGSAVQDSLDSGETVFLLGDTPRIIAASKRTATPDSAVAANAAASDTVDSHTSGDLPLSSLRSRIDAMADLLEDGEGIEGYAECVEERFIIERRPYTPHHIEERMDSGLPAGSVFADIWDSPGLDDFITYFKGPDKHLFEDEKIDSNDDPADGYHLESRSRRPLPRGEYKLEYYDVHVGDLPCGYAPLASYWTIHVIAPNGTLHEAFFDPAAMDGGGAGADDSNGVLKPAAFSLADGTGASLQSVSWQSSAVEMRLEPHSRLAGYYADFIALDGSVSLRLDFDDATETTDEGGSPRGLSWPVCVRPWESGDLLMLRISQSPPNLIGATRDMGCADAPTPAE